MDVLNTILIPFDLENWPLHGGWCLYCNNGGR